MEIADLNIHQLYGLSMTEQAWMIESAERQLDELERRLPDDSDVYRRIERMRHHIIEIQRQLYGC